VRRLARDHAFSQLRELALSESASEGSVVDLLASENLTNLHDLVLLGLGRLGPATLRALVSSPSLGALRSLTVGYDRRLLADGGADRLAAWPGLARLGSLTIRGEVGLTDDGLRVLAAAPSLAGLKELCLVRCDRLPAAGVAALAGSPHLSGLRRLQIHGGLEGRDGEEAVAALRARFGDRLVFSGGAEGGRR
jgi:hypothetical protein